MTYTETTRETYTEECHKEGEQEQDARARGIEGDMHRGERERVCERDIRRGGV